MAVMEGQQASSTCCGVCGGWMQRTGSERLSNDLTGLRSGRTLRTIQEEIACPRCGELEWVTVDHLPLYPSLGSA
jgi:hypothetical protein